jgi:hypothetical protein
MRQASPWEHAANATGSYVGIPTFADDERRAPPP